MKPKTYFDITKEYPEMFRITVYKSPYTPKENKEKKEQQKLDNDFSTDSSIRRTRRTLHDFVKCNDFELFVTFTFDPKKVNRYDMSLVYLKMQGWLKRQHDKNPDFKYIIVPEKHIDGAIHFHALMSDYPFSLKKTNVIQNSRRVYNVSSFRFGFTNAQFLDADDKEKTANYIAKYITKGMIVLSNKRRYWSSKNLRKPQVHYNSIFDLGLIPHLSHKSEINETDFNITYEVPKFSLDI